MSLVVYVMCEPIRRHHDNNLCGLTNETICGIENYTNSNRKEACSAEFRGRFDYKEYFVLRL